MIDLSSGLGWLTWDFLIDAMSWVLIFSGSFFLFIGSLGMLRLQDFWSRLHAASIIDSAGVGLLLFGMMLQGGFTLATLKLAFIVIFLFITGPTASHAVANAAFVSGSRPMDLVEDVTTKRKRKKKVGKK
jgi:multicomponent Na+:H+ antiporter subunit G